MTRARKIVGAAPAALGATSMRVSIFPGGVLDRDRLSRVDRDLVRDGAWYAARAATHSALVAC